MKKKYLVLAAFILLAVIMLESQANRPEQLNLSHLPAWQRPFVPYFAERGFEVDDLLKLSFTFNQTDTLVRLMALQAAYPDLITNIQFVPEYNDWLITFHNDMQLYFAYGRKLPHELLAQADNFRRFVDYQLPPHQEEPVYLYTAAEVAAPANPAPALNPVFHTAWYEVLYGGSTRETIEQKVVETSFLGFDFPVHQMIYEPLRQVEEQIFAHIDDEIADFIATLNFAAGYSWRNIIGTTTLSFHALGVAIDILPENRDQPIYWIWEMRRNPNWAQIPADERWQIPNLIIAAFEEAGFFWGGNWSHWDIMHFEYRPEFFKARQFRREFNEFIGFTYFRNVN
ncbi:MAG: M15 family metallopeptidase [Spirochaetaceae bacterium]|nr:M15 family metallopeptidase [Spirochaetaceae bacterium]